MNGSYLLDTNIVIGYLAGESEITQALDRVHDIHLPAVVLGELHYGVQKSEWQGENLERLEQFVLDVSIVKIDYYTARTYGNVKNQLRAKGHPIPDNDIWIAAIALQRGYTLATRDSHFTAVDGLKIESWCEA